MDVDLFQTGILFRRCDVSVGGNNRCCHERTRSMIGILQVLWTDHLCENFELLVCLAILISQKAVIMESKFGCNEILKVSLTDPLD